MPKSLDQLKKMMFPKESSDSQLDYYDNAIIVGDVVQRVWDDIQRLKDPNTGKFQRVKSQRIIEELTTHEYGNDSDPEMNEIKRKWDKYNHEFNMYWQGLSQIHGKDFIQIMRELSNDWRIKELSIHFIWQCIKDKKIALLNKAHKNETVRHVCNYTLTHKLSIDKKTFMSIRKRMSEHDKTWRKQWEEEDVIRRRNGREMYKKFRQETKDKKIVIFSYGDENGSFDSVMEHGEIFRNVNHIQVSHH
jgi:hypothetical protein